VRDPSERERELPRLQNKKEKKKKKKKKKFK
jgi:hypothetical protein